MNILIIVYFVSFAKMWYNSIEAYVVVKTICFGRKKT